MTVEKTAILSQYLSKLTVRILIVAAVTFVYFFHREYITGFLTRPVVESLRDRTCWPLIALWAVLMVMMFLHLTPPKVFTMGVLKMKEDKLDLDPRYDRGKILEFVQRQNVGAWKVMLAWVLLNGAIGMLYLFDVLEVADLFMITIFYFLCDYICILFYCPFQSHIMHNKCCVNCRIYDWGHFMMFTPMVFVTHFFSWTLFWLSVIVLIHWEIAYALHPERFNEISNRALRCSNCTDKSCQLKKIVTRRETHVGGTGRVSHPE